jgi:hypothetical protein
MKIDQKVIQLNYQTLIEKLRLWQSEYSKTLNESTTQIQNKVEQNLLRNRISHLEKLLKELQVLLE